MTEQPGGDARESETHRSTPSRDEAEDGETGRSSPSRDDVQGGEARRSAASRDDGATDIGTVYLVGAGPGDPDLLTVKARRLIDEADVILHDKLSGPDILADIPEAQLEDVGTRGGGERTPQSVVNERLVTLARAGNTVVRLKGGDPTVFGRGGEEMAHLADEGIPFEVVPGVTSAIAGPDLAGIPVTHREHASSVTFVTGHEDPAKAESSVDWQALAATGGTLVVLMGVGRLGEYTDELLTAGMDPETPVALVERASWPDQRAVSGTLSTIEAVAENADIEPPAVTIIGGVAGIRDRVIDAVQTAERIETDGSHGEER